MKHVMTELSENNPALLLMILRRQSYGNKNRCLPYFERVVTNFRQDFYDFYFEFDCTLFSPKESCVLCIAGGSLNLKLGHPRSTGTTTVANLAYSSERAAGKSLKFLS